MRRWADNLGVAIGAGLLALTGVAAAVFEGAAPTAPDAFTGRVYALPLPWLRRVYLTETQHDLLAVAAAGGVAAIFVGVVLSPAIRRRGR